MRIKIFFHARENYFSCASKSFFMRMKISGEQDVLKEKYFDVFRGDRAFGCALTLLLTKTCGLIRLKSAYISNKHELFLKIIADIRLRQARQELVLS